MQDIALAIGLKLVFFVLALTGAATLWLALFADVGAKFGRRCQRAEASS